MIAKRVLVTGGAGFIGSHLCDKLIRAGNEVICCDNLFTGGKNNIYHLMGNSQFEFLRHDITFPLYVEVDEIYNLACPASPIKYQYDPVQTTKVNVIGSINMLGLAKRLKAKILQASTSEVYGDAQEIPQMEEYRGNVNPIGTRACYDEGKRCAETLFFDYYRQHMIDIRVVRIFNTYGERMHPYDGRVVSEFIRQALREEPISIFGDGSQTRSFCYISDMVDGIYKMMENSSGIIGPINLGNPYATISILELAKKIVNMTNSKSNIVFKSLPTDDPAQRQPNIDRAKTMLNWSPIIDLDTGLRNIIDYFKRKIL